MGTWRARIGKVSPSRGDTYVYEFYRMVPENILLSVIAATVKKLTPEDFSRAFEVYEKAAITLAEEGAEVLILGGGPVFLSQGEGSEEALCSRIEKATSLPVITEFPSAADACRTMGIKRLAILSPYREGLNGQIQSRFQAMGFQVPLIRGLGIERNIEIGKLPEDEAFHLAMTAFREGASGVWITTSLANSLSSPVSQ